MRRDRAILFRAWALLMTSGTPITRGLTLLGKQLENPRLARACEQVAAELEKGTPLPHAMARQKCFSMVQLKLIEAGCNSGQLEVVLRRLADHEERHGALEMKARAALVYPACVLAVALLVVVIVPPLMFGDLFKLIRDTGVETPVLTRMLASFSDLVRSWLFWAVMATVGAAASYALPPLLRRRAVRRALEERLWRLRGVGSGLQALAATRCARTLEVVVGAGVSLLVGLKLAGQATGSLLVEERMERALVQLKEGEALPVCLEGTGLFPRMFVQAVALGQESGQLTKMLGKLCDMLEAEMEYRLEIMAAMLEPLIMGLVGVIVGVIALAAILPLMKVVESL